jgi:hypothetical protein
MYGNNSECYLRGCQDGSLCKGKDCGQCMRVLQGYKTGFKRKRMVESVRQEDKGE